MENSEQILAPFQFKDLNLREYHKGKTILCGNCSTPVVLQVDIWLGTREILVCRSCMKSKLRI